MGCAALTGLALAGAGAGVNEYANQRVSNKMNNQVNQELARQAQYQRRGSQVFNNSLSQSTPQAANSQVQQGQQQLANLIANNQAVPLSLSMPSFGDINTTAETTRRNMSNQAASNLGGYSNYGLQQRLKDIAAQSQLGLIGNQAAQSAGVLPYELQQAQLSERGLQGIGSLLGTAGGLVGLSGLLTAPTVVPNTAGWGFAGANSQLPFIWGPGSSFAPSTNLSFGLTPQL